MTTLSEREKDRLKQAYLTETRRVSDLANSVRSIHQRKHSALFFQYWVEILIEARLDCLQKNVSEANRFFPARQFNLDEIQPPAEFSCNLFLTALIAL